MAWPLDFDKVQPLWTVNPQNHLCLSRNVYFAAIKFRNIYGNFTHFHINAPVCN